VPVRAIFSIGGNDTVWPSYSRLIYGSVMESTQPHSFEPNGVPLVVPQGRTVVLPQGEAVAEAGTTRRVPEAPGPARKSTH
jgi:hypothetical protein